jgi:hypothetical protein
MTTTTQNLMIRKSRAAEKIEFWMGINHRATASVCDADAYQDVNERTTWADISIREIRKLRALISRIAGPPPPPHAEIAAAAAAEIAAAAEAAAAEIAAAAAAADNVASRNPDAIAEAVVAAVGSAAAAAYLENMAIGMYNACTRRESRGTRDDTIDALRAAYDAQIALYAEAARIAAAR